MSFDALNRYNPNHKVWDHVGNIIPDIEHSEGERPAIELKVAAWLPVVFFDKHYENWHVVMPGKAIALDPNGDAMPAGYGLTSASVVYTQADVDAGVIDIATGAPVTVAKTVVLANLTGVRESGWSAANAGVSKTSAFLGKWGVAFGDAAAKYPIGVAPYSYLQWCGGDGVNPALYAQHNYNMQHKVAVLCDYVIRLPLVPAQVANEVVEPAVAGTDLVFATRDTHTRAQVQANATGRYNPVYGVLPVLSTYPVIALALDEVKLARSTMRTSMVMSSSNAADDLSSILVEEKTALAAVRQAGDFFVDYEFGVVFLYSSDGATVPTAISGAAGTVRLTYYRYGTAPGVLSKFACVLAGGIQAGDFLKVGTGSNLVKATSEDFKSIVGQVLAFESYPRDSLERVRTSFTPALKTDSLGSMSNGVASGGSVNMGQMDQMAGTATGGVPDLIHYAGAADQIVIINLVSR
jgi:hypothetical protein